jgi:GrpB-like predicted nucleotidyltransferase (UPF0157 family)
MVRSGTLEYGWWMSCDDGDSSLRAEVRPHDPSWLQRGEAWADELRQALAPLALRADHIGSTAIPGMAAKPVFDLQISVADLDQAAHAFDGPLAQRGFARCPYQQDHVPAGHHEPPERWANRMCARRDRSREAINLHVRVRSAPNERLSLLFRDWFRAHPAAVPAYGRFKSLLSAAVPDIAIYTVVKDPVIDVVIVAAEDWALLTDW